MTDASEIEVTLYVPEHLDGASAMPGQAQPGTFAPATDTEEIEIEVTVE